jgi:sugar transferase (PEP-CTERM/EpsH1 system associated)
MDDLDGTNVTNQRIRRFYKPFIHHYMALSRDLAEYLVQKVYVPQVEVTQAYNGVDTGRFFPAAGGQQPIPGCPFDPSKNFLIGTVGRMQTVKDQVMLVHAFIQAIVLAPRLRLHMRLVMVGEGPLRAQAQALLDEAGLSAMAWLPGERSDVASIMRGLHVFALPSLAEGISNTVLEAMASGLPVIATAVGGNADLVEQGHTGYIVPPGHPQAMALRMVALASHPDRAHRMGHAGRERVVAKFSMQAMVATYQAVYDEQMRRINPTQQKN